MSDTRFSSSPFVGEIEPIVESDEEIRAYLADAEVPPLLPALAYLTGDMSLLRDDLRPEAIGLGMPQGGLTDSQQAEARELALQTLVRFRDGGCRPAPPPSEAETLQIMEYAVGGGPDMAEYLPLLEEELAVRGEDRRDRAGARPTSRPTCTSKCSSSARACRGSLAGHRLRQAGIPFVIVEKNDDVGGTWLENTYPGCRVDNPNHNYSFSFAQRHDWPFHFSTQDVLLDYFRRCADAFGLRDNVRFSTEVRSAAWSETDRTWTVVVRGRDGREESIVANAVISAVGQLNRPRYPDIAGRDSFAGPAFHSARWDHSIDLRNKRVAVIGTGASAVQFIPEIAGRVGELVVFQRTPPWLGPTDNYHAPVEAGLQWLYSHVPSYSEWNRFLIFWKMGDGVLAGVRVDPDWEPKDRAVGLFNDILRQLLTDYLTEHFAAPTGSPRTGRARRIPPGRSACCGTTASGQVRCTAPTCSSSPPRSARSRRPAIVTDDGVAHDVDVIIYGTGFQASKFLTPMQVTGRDGVDLHEHWKGDARAYLGVTIPGFPNLFCLYGPNTNIVINGSIIYFSECGVRYILGLLRLVFQGDHAALDVRKDVHDEFNERVDAENAVMAWGWSDVSSWYKNEHGHVSQNWPFTLLEYWQRTLSPDPAEYELID